MTIKTYKDEDGFKYVEYAEGKRPLKFSVYVISEDNENGDDVMSACLDMVIDFVIANANAPEHLRTMTEANFWRLVERLSVKFCRFCSPTTNYGIKKPEIRSAVYFVLNAGIQAGYWPDNYEITEKTFVQLAGDRDE